MIFGREKRLWAGLLAILAPLPLPFNEVLEWPVLALDIIVLALFLSRAWADPPNWLPPWAMNVLGVAYLPLAWVDVTVLSHFQFVRPLLHLGLFTLAVKLFAMRRESEKWHVVLGAFFIFLAAMGTSHHPAILLYLIGFLVVFFIVLVRFATWHVLAAFGRTDGTAAVVPVTAYLVTACGLTLLAAVPLFALLPRVRSPFAFAGPASAQAEASSAGFGDALGLDDASRVRGNRGVALRLEFAGSPPPNHEFRYRAATYDEYLGVVWRKTRVLHFGPPRDSSGAYRIAAGVPSMTSVRVYLEPLNARSLPLPEDATTLRLEGIEVRPDAGGTLSLGETPRRTVEYRVGLAARSTVAETVSAEPEMMSRALDLGGLTPRMRQLAAEVAGTGSAAERAARLERHMLTEYEYTLDLVGRGAREPLEEFLFEHGSGHCELFASALVLLLRSEGIPARVVTGFLGAELNPLEGYYVVRQGNAHAWVEAWIEGQGWTVFDPTPPDGRPQSREQGLGLWASQVSDWILFRWDRYVLSYDFEDQVAAFGAMRRWWSTLWDDLFRDRAAEAPPATAAVEVEEDPVVSLPGLPEARRRGLAAMAGVLLLVGVLVGLAWAWRRRTPLSATRVYERLRFELRRGDRAIDDSTPPLELARRAARRHPAAADATGRIVERYVRESFGGEALAGEAERQALRADLAESLALLRRAS